jgi:hypothetical protein
MPEQPTTPPTAPAPGATPSKPPRSRGVLNQEQLDNLNKAEELCAVARSPEYASALAGREIDAAFLTALENDIKTARRLAGEAVGGSASRQSATAAEKLAMEASSPTTTSASA